MVLHEVMTMKATIRKQAILPILQRTVAAWRYKHRTHNQTPPSVMLHTPTDDKLVISSTFPTNDGLGNVAFSFEVPATVEERGKIYTNGHVFAECVRQSNANDIHMCYHEDGHLELTADNVAYRLVSYNATTWPGIPPDESFPELFTERSPSCTITFAGYAFDKLLSNVLFIKPSTTEANIRSAKIIVDSDGAFSVLATDRYQFVNVQIRPESIQGSHETLIPLQSLQVLQQLMAIDDTVTLEFIPSSMLAKNSNMRFCCRSASTQYPDVSKLLTHKSEYYVEIDKTAFLSALRRLKALRTFATDSSITLTFSDNLHISIATESGVGDEYVPCIFTTISEGIKIQIRHSWLQDAITQICENTVRLGISTSPPLIQIEASNDLIGLIANYLVAVELPAQTLCTPL